MSWLSMFEYTRAFILILYIYFVDGLLVVDTVRKGEIMLASSRSICTATCVDFKL